MPRGLLNYRLPLKILYKQLFTIYAIGRQLKLPPNKRFSQQSRKKEQNKSHQKLLWRPLCACSFPLTATSVLGFRGLTVAAAQAAGRTIILQLSVALSAPLALPLMQGAP